MTDFANARRAVRREVERLRALEEAARSVSLNAYARSYSYQRRDAAIVLDRIEKRAAKEGVEFDESINDPEPPVPAEEREHTDVPEGVAAGAGGDSEKNNLPDAEAAGPNPSTKGASRGTRKAG